MKKRRESSCFMIQSWMHSPGRLMVKLYVIGPLVDQPLRMVKVHVPEVSEPSDRLSKVAL